MEIKEKRMRLVILPVAPLGGSRICRSQYNTPRRRLHPDAIEGESPGHLRKKSEGALFRS